MKFSPFLFILAPVHLPPCAYTPFPYPPPQSFLVPTSFIFLKLLCLFLLFIQLHLITFLLGNSQTPRLDEAPLIYSSFVLECFALYVMICIFCFLCIQRSLTSWVIIALNLGHRRHEGQVQVSWTQDLTKSVFQCRQHFA